MVNPLISQPQRYGRRSEPAEALALRLCSSSVEVEQGMSGKFGVELPTMQAAGQHVDEVNNQIQSQLTSLLNRLEPLKGAWKGEGATSFNALIERWHQDATQLNSALLSIGERLTQTHSNITQTEGEVGQSFNTITSRLG